MRLVERVRDALSGRYVSSDQARRSPSTTVTETESGLRVAAVKLLKAYDADDTDRASALAPQLEDLRAAVGMPPPGFRSGGIVPGSDR